MNELVKQNDLQLPEATASLRSVYIVKVLAFCIGFRMLSFMDTQTTDASEGSLPQTISDAAWKSMLPFLKAFPNVYVGDPETCRRFLSAVVWITKEGASWRALPNVYGYWNTIYRRYSRWCDAGVFEALHEHFHDAGELSAILVDSTIVRAHSCAAGVSPKKKEDKRGQLSDAAVADSPQNFICR